jgi:ribosome-binding protein aMBF1 (putative translation factor)
MSTIMDNVKFSPYERPNYTSYKLGKLVKEKRVKSGLSLNEFANKFDISVELLTEIEKAEMIFNVNMYKAASKILDISISEIAKIDKDDPESISFRCGEEINKNASQTIELAHRLFHEMVCQSLIAAR